MPNRLYLKMLDIYIEQTENSASIILSAMQDVQNLYMAGTKMVLKAGQVLDKQSILKLPLAEEVSNLFEETAPAVMKAQRDLADASINANLIVAESIRENLTARASVKNEKDQASTENEKDQTSVENEKDQASTENEKNQTSVENEKDQASTENEKDQA